MIDLYDELSETSRRKILIALYDGPKNVNALVALTQLKQPNVSNHLSRMRSKDIVKAAKYGREVIYSLHGPEVERIVAALLVPSNEPEKNLDLDELAVSFARLATSGEEEQCAAIFESLFRAKTPLLDIYERVVSQSMKIIGTWWKVSAIDEAQEHMASSIIHGLLARSQQVYGVAPRTGRTVLSGCAPDCYHVLGLTVATDYLKFAGWRAFSLGANVPIKAFLSSVKTHRPDLVMTNLHTEVGIPPTLNLIRALHESRDRSLHFKIAVGGLLVEELKKDLLEAGADYAVISLRQFAEEVVPEIEKPTRPRGKLAQGSAS